MKDWSMLKKLLFLKASGGKATENTATGNPLTFTTNIAKPLKSLLIPWTPTQAGSGDPSPENVRPITGLDGVTVWHCGKNLWNGEVINGNINNSGQNSGATGDRLISSFVALAPGTYCVSNSVDFSVAVYAYTTDDESTFISAESNVYWNANPVVFTLTNGRYVRFKWKNADGTAVAPTDLTEIQIELGEASPYTPYTGQSYPVTFPDGQTVYGGTLDITSGVLTVEWVVADIADLGWTYSSTGEYFSTAVAGRKKSKNVLCTCYKKTVASTVSGMSNLEILAVNSNTGCFIKDSEYSDAPTFKNARKGEKICYELETPQTVTLTPQQITTLLGDNTIWTDTNGTNTAVYLKRG